MKEALEGIRILDLTLFEAGTTCTELLAFLGAEVIKIEEPKMGEPGRYSFTEKPGFDSYYFVLLNLNKKSISLNLRDEKGKDIFKELVKKADVVVNNFSVGTMENLGLGYEVLKVINPRIIYASVTGFGTTGPYKTYPSVDIIAQATGGIMSTTGYPENPPTRIGTGLGDSGGGINLFAGILAALYQREKTGKGQAVEVSMQDSIFAFLRPMYNFHFMSGKPIQRTGNPGPVAPYNTYKTKDGYVVIGLFQNSLWYNLLKAIDREDVKDDPRMKDPLERGKNRELVDSIVEEWTKDKDKREVMSYLAERGVPCGAVLDTEELLSDLHLLERDMILEIEHPQRGKVKVLGCQIKLSESPVNVKSPPLLGQHNEEVYEVLMGYSKDDIVKLKDQGVI